MTTTNYGSFIPSRFRILSGSALKMIAIITMLIDHTGVILLRYFPWANTPCIYLGDTPYSLYRISRDIGRVALPIFCFLLVEGFVHTRNRWKYGRNLFLFALISEIPWNFMHTGDWFCPKQNVFFTLFLGYLAFCAIEYFWEKRHLQILCILLLLLCSMYLNADYGWKGYIFLLIMYFFRMDRTSQAVVGSCWLYYEWKACFAFLSTNMYNGTRGFIKGKFAKYFFYAFYPLHITVLMFLKYYFFGTL